MAEEYIPVPFLKIPYDFYFIPYRLTSNLMIIAMVECVRNRDHLDSQIQRGFFFKF